jgi:hypothetical protein
MRGYFLALAWWMGLAVALPGQVSGFLEAKSLKAYFFSPVDGRPWALASVGEAKRERQKIGFFQVGILPTLVFQEGTLELNLDHFEVTAASKWLQGLMDNPKTKGARVAPARVILRQDGKILWDCTADVAIVGTVEGVALRGVTVRDAAGTTWKAAGATLVLDRDQGCLRATLQGRTTTPADWVFNWPKPGGP